MYTPQIDSAAGKIIGVEVLLHWNHSTLGNIESTMRIKRIYLVIENICKYVYKCTL